MKINKIKILLVLILMMLGNEMKSEKTLAPTEPIDGKIVQGYYVVDYESSIGHWGLLDIRIEDNKALINGLFMRAHINGEYNPETRVLKIPSDQSTFYTGNDGTNVILFFDQYLRDNGKVVGQLPLPYGELIYIPAGEKDPEGRTYDGARWYMDPSTVIIFCERHNRETLKLCSCGSVRAITPAEAYYKMTPFTYSEEEWENCGAATFTDGWFAEANGDEGFGPYEVECRKRGSEILLVTPYGKTSPYAGIDPKTGRPYNISAETSEGFILLDIGDPECVMVRPFISCGYNNNGFYGMKKTLEDTELFYPCYGFFACTNREGILHYLRGGSTEEIKKKWNGSLISTMNSTGLIRLASSFIQCPSRRSSDINNGWTGAFVYPEKETRETFIQLPEAAYSSVEEVSVAPDEPARYFSLQGIELTAPTPGTPVIVREGNRTRKVIF